MFKRHSWRVATIFLSAIIVANNIAFTGKKIVNLKEPIHKPTAKSNRTMILDYAKAFPSRVIEWGSRNIFGKDLRDLVAGKCPMLRHLPNSSSVALTFDDGPERYTQRVLEELDRLKLKATFFCVGRNAKKYPRLLKEVGELGHEIANHTMNHTNFHWITKKKMELEIFDCQKVLEDISGKPIDQFRAPYGHFRFDMTRPNKFGLKNFVWRNVSPPWNAFETDVYIENIQNNTAPGAIILLHDWLEDVDVWQAETCVSAMIRSLGVFVPALRATGIKFETVSEALRNQVLDRRPFVEEQ